MNCRQENNIASRLRATTVRAFAQLVIISGIGLTKRRLLLLLPLKRKVHQILSHVRTETDFLDNQL
ncbi:hypothetical protein T07_5242 [Trichinella nelsoni]|uniref:Uncharacterized protein n=1 Tax=Trichinella nelsoni TaxID=6336 RepID=A0A0V0RKS1_9BILA|nr:hypothetical protein T07_5242 [Trichinella nelsoni]